MTIVLGNLNVENGTLDGTEPEYRTDVPVLVCRKFTPSRDACNSFCVFELFNYLASVEEFCGPVSTVGTYWYILYFASDTNLQIS